MNEYEPPPILRPDPGAPEHEGPMPWWVWVVLVAGFGFASTMCGLGIAGII